MRLDLHTHSRHSPDSRVEPVEIVRRARALGLDGVAITDHNSVAGVRAAEEAAREEDGFLVVPAVEVSTSEGHVLAYGVREAIPRDLPPAQTVERVEALGGVAIAAHPYRFWSGLGEAATLSAGFPAYEVQNARTLRGGNGRARALAARTRVGATGGSDAHFVHEVGRAITSIEGGRASLDAVLQALAAGRTEATGEDRGARQTLVYVTKCVSEWIARGMRRI